MAATMRRTTTVIVYEKGIPVAKWRMWPENGGTQVEQTAIKGFQPYAMTLNLMIIVEMIANPVWGADIRRLITLFDNDRADEELEARRASEDDELPF